MINSGSTFWHLKKMKLHLKLGLPVESMIGRQIWLTYFCHPLRCLVGKFHLALKLMTNLQAGSYILLCTLVVEIFF